jgi:PAS domain S-box-containing protein
LEVDTLTRTLFELSPAGVLLLRPLYEEGQLVDFAFEHINPAGQQMLRLPAQSSQTFLQRYPMAVDTGIFAFHRDAFLGGESDFHGLEYRYDGLDAYYQVASQRADELLVVTFTDSADRPQGDLVIDVQRRRQAEQQAYRTLMAQQQLLENVFAQAPAGIWVVQGPDYVLELCNPQMGRIIGCSPADIIGRPYFDVLPELVSQGIPELLQQVWTGGQAVVVEEYPAHMAPRHAPGEVGYFSFVFQGLHDEQGQLTRIGCVALDVTAQVVARQQVQDLNQELAATNEKLTATNEELYQSNMRLTRANTDLGTFVYTASHDLKAPITNIEGLVAALRDILPPAAQQDEMVGQLLGLLDTTAHRFVKTISQLTDLSRLQTAYEEPAELLALEPVVEGVLADLKPVVAEAQAVVEVQVPAELFVAFAAASLRSIIYNLLSNAVKYRHPQRPALVWVQAERQPQGIVLTVRDNGLGLTDSQQQRLFHVFQRLHTHVEGSGVGLYMIKRLIENAGASIAVTSTVDVGSTVTVVFPA